HGAAVQPAPVTVVADDQGAHDAVTLYGNEQGFVIPRKRSSKDFAGSIARLRVAKVDLPKLAYLSRVFGPCRSNLHGSPWASVSSLPRGRYQARGAVQRNVLHAEPLPPLDERLCRASLTPTQAALPCRAR